MCPPGYHHNRFVATHAVGHMMYGSSSSFIKCMSCHKAIVVITGRAHCFHDNIYIDIDIDTDTIHGCALVAIKAFW